MTDAKLVTSPAHGHGLTSRITDAHFAAAVKGEPLPHLVAICVLKQVGLGERDTSQGKHRSVTYEIIKLEPLLDREQAANARLILHACFEQRTSAGEQGTLALSFPGQADEENRKALLERIEDWAERTGISGAQLEQKWHEHWGIGAGQEWSYGDRGVPAEYGRSPAAWLLEFGIECGAISEESASEPEGDDDSGDLAPDADADGDDEAADSDTSDEAEDPEDATP